MWRHTMQTTFSHSFLLSLLIIIRTTVNVSIFTQEMALLLQERTEPDQSQPDPGGPAAHPTPGNIPRVHRKLGNYSGSTLSPKKIISEVLIYLGNWSEV